MKTQLYYIDDVVDKSWNMLSYDIINEKNSSHFTAYKYSVENKVNLIVVEKNCILLEEFPEGFFDSSDLIVLARKEKKPVPNEISLKCYYVTPHIAEILLKNEEKSMTFWDWFIEMAIELEFDLNAKYVVAK